jgi:Tol biopolymer transport system component
MGEVYRAKDIKLNRTVAIKVLPGAVKDDPERRERFEREAQAIAALNHPNIVTIHSVENAGEAAFLVMELVEGRALSEEIPRGGLPLDQLLKVAIPVVDAVVAAHQKSITHRDLKPANVMIGRGEHQGRVKVLDFGLAKLAGTSPGDAGMTTMPTALATGEGRILGTVAYMSPEQAEGKAIDARSDLFSLGVILYEMACGDRPFTGATSISIISAIVKDTPKSLTAINPAIPRDLARIVRRALAKDPEKRYQTAKDLRNDLEELKASLDSGELLAETTQSGAPVHAGKAGMWRGIAIGAIAVAVIAIGTVAVVLRRGTTSTPAQTSAAPLTMTALTSTGNAELGTLSPDGKYVAYVQTDDGQQSVWVRQITSGSTVRAVLPAPGLAIWGLTITPDASFNDFVRNGDKTLELWRAPLLGGPARKLVDDVTSAPGWSPDGKQMAYLINLSGLNERQLIVAEADGSEPRVIASRKLPLRYLTLSLTLRPDLRPAWLPDGQAIAVIGSDEVRAPGAAQLISVNVATGAETELRAFSAGGNPVGHRAGMAVGRDGQSVIVNRGESGTSQVVTVGLRNGEMTRLTNDLATYAGVSVAGDAIVTTRYQTNSGVWVTDETGHSARQVRRDAPSEFGGLTWAGNTRLIYGAALAGGVGVWSTDVASGASELVVPGARNPSTSADGRTLVFSKSGRELWRADGDGSHAAHIADLFGVAAQITPDGSKVFYISSQSGTQVVWVADLAGGHPRQITTLNVSASSAPTVSRDGRYVMFIAAGSAVILPVDGGEPVHRMPMPNMPNTSLRWTPDGRSLTYVDLTGSNIWLQPIDGAAPRQVTTFTDSKRIADFAWSPDGKQLAVTRAITTSDIVLLKGVR